MALRGRRRAGVRLTITGDLILILGCIFSFANYGHDDLPLAPAHIALQVKDLLPSTQDRLAIGNWHCERWPEQRSLQMRVAIAIVASLFVAIVAAGKDELVQNGTQIILNPRLELDCADRTVYCQR